MKTISRALMFIVPLILVGTSCFYLGIREGANTMAKLASQNEVSGALGRLNSSIIALKKQDLSYSLEQNQQDFNQALFDLGSYAPAVPYWKCEDRDRAVVSAAKGFLVEHPNLVGTPPKPLLERALRFCQ